MPAHTEYLNANTLSAFPFMPGATGIRWGTGAGIPFGLFVELGLVVPTEVIDSGATIYLRQLSNPSAESMTATFGTEDETFVVSFAFVASPGYTYGTSLSGVRHFATVHTDTMLAYLVEMTDTETFGTTLPLQAGALQPDVPRLTHLSASNDMPYDAIPSGAFRVGDVTLRAGHNIRLQQTAGQITVSAVPGEGLGRLECEEPPENTHPPMGLAPTAGNIEIRAGEEACYTVVPQSSGVFQIQGRCVACCTCDDYVDMMDELKALADRIIAVRDVLETGHEKYEEGVTYYNETIVPGLHHVTLGLNGMRGSDYADPNDPLRGAPNRVRLVATITNRRADPSSITSWGLVVTSPDTGVTIESISYQYRGTGGTVANGGALPDILPNTRLSLTFLISTPLHVWNALDPKEWKATLSVTANTYGTIDTLSQEVVIT